MTNQLTLSTCFYVFLSAFGGFVADLIAFEAKFFGALVGVVIKAAAEDAAGAFSFVGTVARQMTKLLAITTFQSWIVFLIIPYCLGFEFLELVVILIFIGIFILI